MARENRPLVLLVDDEPLFRSSVAAALSEPGATFDVITAADGQEALELLERQRVDLLVTDVNMPELDGFGLLREYMRIQPGSPALVLTAYGSPQLEEDLSLLGGIGYLEKPIEILDLSNRIEDLLEPVPQGHIEGITLFGFLQLVAIERKTCKLTIRFEGKTAELFFSKGDLVHAQSEELEGEEAVLQLGDWAVPQIDIEHLTRTSKRTVESSLTELLLEAARLADEHRTQEADEPSELPEESGSDRPRLEPFRAERGRRWIEQAQRLLGDDGLPEIIVALRLTDGSLAALRGPDTIDDWADAILAFADTAIRLSDREGSATCEVIAGRVGLGVIWSDDLALVVADVLPSLKSSAWFRSQLGTLTRVVWETDSTTKGD